MCVHTDYGVGISQYQQSVGADMKICFLYDMP